VLPIGTRLQVDLRLEVGAVSETVTVSDGIDLINTDELTSGGVLESKSALDLPNPGENTIVLAKITVGLQSSQSVTDWSVRLHRTGAGSNYTMAGGVGGNEYAVDGVSNNGGTRNPGYMPAPDLVEAMRVETSALEGTLVGSIRAWRTSPGLARPGRRSGTLELSLPRSRTMSCIVLYRKRLKCCGSFMGQGTGAERGPAAKTRTCYNE
jgi:hypothetical protein